MENENWQPNQKVGSNVEIEQKAPKPTTSKRIYGIIVGIIAIIVAFILGSVVTILVQNIIGQNNNSELPWENNNEDREYILSSEIVSPEEFQKLETSVQIVSEGGYVFKDYEDYEDKVQNIRDQMLLSESDFKQHKYGLVTIRTNDNVTPVEISVDGNIVTVRVIRSAGGCTTCSQMYQNFLVELDSAINDPVIMVREDTISSRDSGNTPTGGILKPMIYLYPEEETTVSVQLGKPEKLTATYPEYNNTWKVTARPNGVLHDATGREYYGLYWEGTNGNAMIREDGFVVAGEDTAKFLEEKLATLGLTEREANEFIVYWLPKLEANRYNYIRFETQEEINEYMPLEVTPAPDTVIRILMDYKPLDAPIEVAEQKFSTPARQGFTLVEWGGTEIGTEAVK